MNFKLNALPKMQLFFFVLKNPNLNGPTDVVCDKVIWGEVTPRFPAWLLLIQGRLAPLKVACSTLQFSRVSVSNKSCLIKPVT